MALNPAVVDKQLVDLSLNGPDESMRPELLDWTKRLSTAKNVAYDFKGGFNKRPGIVSLATADDTSTAFSNVYRLVPTEDGLAFIGKNHQLYQVNESSGSPVAKNRTSEWGVTRLSGGSAQRISYSLSFQEGNIIGVYLCSKYRILISGAAGGSNHIYTISFLDKYSSNIVRKYRIDPGTADSGLVATVVDDRYLHVAYTLTGGAKGKFFQIDTNSLTTASGTLSPTLVTLADPTDGVAVGAVAISGASIVVQNKITTCYIEKFDTAGASVTSTTITTFKCTGVATDGTSFYLAGYDTSGPTDRFKVLNSSLSVTRTVTDAGPSATAGKALRIAVDGSGNACLVSYDRVASTLYSGIYMPVATVYTCGSAATSFTLVGKMYAWTELCQPFYNSITGRFYVGLLKQLTGNSGSSVSRDTIAGCAALVDISEASGGISYTRFRPAAILDNYTATQEHNDQEYGVKLQPSTLGFGVLGYQAPIASVSSDGYTVVVGVLEQAASGLYAQTIAELSLKAPEVLSSAGTAISGGVTANYDNFACSELGFVDTPSIFVKEAGSGVGATTGLHTFYAVYLYRNASGVVYSRFSRPSAITSSAFNINLEIVCPWVTSHGQVGDNSLVGIEVYGTTAGGQTLYLVQTLTPTTTVTSGSLTITDAVLATRPEAFRQPEFDGAALDRYSALASSHILQHKDRLFYCNGSNVYYSSFFVDGESPWFNPSFFISVPGGQGPVTALGSLDGNLVVFKRNAIFLVDGDGPPENGGTGTEFSPPRRLQTEFGCVDPRTLVAIPDGLMFRSDRGIEILTRSLSVAWIGEDFQVTVDSYPYNGGAAFDRKSGRALFVVGSAIAADGRISAGSTLVFDTTVSQWSEWPLATAMQDVAYSRLAVSGTEDSRICYASSGTLWYESSSGSLDGSTYAPYTLETGWIRMESLQDRLLVPSFKLMGEWQDNHDLTISVAYDYSDTYTDTITFKASDMVDMEVEQFEFQLPRTAVQAVRFKVQDSAPSDSGNFPVTTGKGLDIFGLTVKLGKKGGGALLPSEQKG